MANVKKALYNVAVFLVSLFITGSINVSNIKNTQDTSRVTLTVNETETLQEMNGWGAAAAWWAQVAGGSKNADDIAKLLYSKEGLGLNIYRYNVGSIELSFTIVGFITKVIANTIMSAIIMSFINSFILVYSSES